MKSDGRVTRGWLGVTIQDVDKNLAESFGLKRPRGALISQVADAGPADKAGLKPGDIILRFDGNDISSSSDLPHVVGLVAPDTSVKVDILRNKKRASLDVTVGGLGSEDSYTLSAGDASEGRGGRIGLVVEDVPADSLERLGLNGGVLVREVLTGSVAAEAGIVSGDIITLIDSSPIKSAESYERVVSGLASGSSVPVRLIRRGSPMFIGLKLKD